MTNGNAADFPKTIEDPGGPVEFRYMTGADRDGVLVFAQQLPTHDLLFLPRDISQPKVLDAWVREIDRGALTTLLAVRKGIVLGCATIVRDPLSWSPHVAELRAVLLPSARGTGLGRRLVAEGFRLAVSLGIEKIVAQMTADQAGAIAVFETMGYRAEALLRDHGQRRRRGQARHRHPQSRRRKSRRTDGVPSGLGEAH